MAKFWDMRPHQLRVGFDIVWSVLYENREYNHSRLFFKKCLYHDDPLSGRQRVGRSLRPPLVGVVTVQRSLLAHVGM